MLRTLMAAHGFSVVELQRRRPPAAVALRPGRPTEPADHGHTPFRLTGPAAGSDLLQDRRRPDRPPRLGTFGNCSGGTTPWGTILSGRGELQRLLPGRPGRRGSKRYGLTDTASVYGWEKIDPRFDATTQPAYANEPHRFGYIVEIDPSDPTSTPRKHTAMGRFKHEGANVRVDRDGTVAAYMGDDERFDYLYKFVAKRKYRPGKSAAARRHNLTVLTEGDLYVASSAASSGRTATTSAAGAWVPLTLDGESTVPGMSLDEVLVFTRQAADLVKATPMDRCEDVEPNPTTGKVYVACTNNTQRGVTAGKPGPDAANPRAGTRTATSSRSPSTATGPGRPRSAGTSCWSAATRPTRRSRPTSPAGTVRWPRSPAPTTSPSTRGGNLWIATDGAPGHHRQGRRPVQGAAGGRRARSRPAVPGRAPGRRDLRAGHPRHRRLGVRGRPAPRRGRQLGRAQQSYFPDYVAAGQKPDRGDWRGPRPTVVQVTKKR